MKPIVLLALSVLLVSVPLGCTGGNGVEGVRNLDVQPRQPQTGDRWCVYTTTAESDEGAIPAQSDLCVLCPAAGCASSVRTITVASGVTYNVGIGGEGTCGRCPAASLENGWTYEPR